MGGGFEVGKIIGKDLFFKTGCIMQSFYTSEEAKKNFMF